MAYDGAEGAALAKLLAEPISQSEVQLDRLV
jgi:hypothetical protein